ncbi:SAP domain-containing protein [Halobacillus mangrovi]|uniref:SAP domain-containing protein n=1 Tax=Halobacillus mangrovi TaxID=402384 RepID=A0A1W5ZY13_9BACI|nr:SAP domain-containing protein [Halobacillus mangrovi]ARI78228.1 hypothetical protein HM131_15825 [Halobacillus mangrovi]
MGLFELLKKAFKESTLPKSAEKITVKPTIEVRKRYDKETKRYDDEQSQNKSFSTKDSIFERQVDRNLNGIELEKEGNVDDAISLYELNIAERFEGNHPYDSLASIYRERKQYDEEIRVLERAIEVFAELELTSPRQDVTPKLQRFRERLEQTKDIKEVSTEKLSNGLFPGEVILIDWISGKPQNVRIPRFFYERYGVNAEESLKKLVKEGYLTEGTPFDSLVSLTIPELKELLRTKQLKVGGKKAELISRIREHFTEEEVKSLVGDNPVLTIAPKGEATLNEFYYIVPAHRHPSSDGAYNVASAIRHVKKFDYNPPNGDISFTLIHEQVGKHAINRKYGLMRNSIRCLAEQLERENRYDDALFHYLRVFISEASGMWNGNRLSLVRNLLIDWFPSYKPVKGLAERLEMSDKELRDMFDYTWGRTRGELSYHYLTKDECYRCLQLAMEKNEKELENLYNHAYERLKAEHDDDSFYKAYGVYFPFDHNERFGSY